MQGMVRGWHLEIQGHKTRLHVTSFHKINKLRSFCVFVVCFGGRRAVGCPVAMQNERHNYANHCSVTEYNGNENNTTMHLTPGCLSV